MPNCTEPTNEEKELFKQIHIIKEETTPVFKDPAITVIEKINALLKTTLEYFVEQRYHEEDFVYEGLTAERKKRLIDLATIDFMRAWIRGDVALRQNVHSFSGNKYKAYECTRGGDFDEGHARAVWRALKEEQYKIYLARRQQNNECQIFTKDEFLAKESFSYAQEVSFYDLWGADAALAGKLDLRDQYLELKKPLGTKPIQGKLEEAYRSYLRIFQQLIPGTDSEKAMGDIEYILSAISAHELEYTYHFGLFALLARCGKEQGKFLDPNLNSEDFRLLWGRAEYITGEQLTGRERVVMYSPYDIFRYQQEIELLYQCHDNEEYKNHYLQEHRADIIILRNILLLAGNIQPPRSLPSLNKRDFETARKFFKDCMPVYSVCSPLTGDESGIKDYRMAQDEFRYIVKVLRFWSALPVEGARREKSEEREAYTAARAHYREKLRT